jgi:hypothetical protein
MSAPNRVAPALGDEALNQDLEGVLTMVRNGAHDDRNGAHDEPECCSRWGRNGAHNEPEWVLTMARNTQERLQAITESRTKRRSGNGCSLHIAERCNS